MFEGGRSRAVTFFNTNKNMKTKDKMHGTERRTILLRGDRKGPKVDTHAHTHTQDTRTHTLMALTRRPTTRASTCTQNTDDLNGVRQLEPCTCTHAHTPNTHRKRPTDFADIQGRTTGANHEQITTRRSMTKTARWTLHCHSRLISYLATPKYKGVNHSAHAKTRYNQKKRELLSK